jgi:hypothetical protein
LGKRKNGSTEKVWRVGLEKEWVNWKSMENWVREGMGQLKKHGELGKRRNGSTEKVWRVG